MEHVPTKGVKLLVILPIAFLWFILIGQLRTEWALNPQYAFGWAVPFLCVFLIWRSRLGEDYGTTGLLDHPDEEEIGSCAAKAEKSTGKIFAAIFVIAALLLAPTRLLQEANPEWRLVSWALALEVIALTLAFLHFALAPSVCSKSEVGRSTDAPIGAEVCGRKSEVNVQPRSDFRPPTADLQSPVRPYLFPILFFLIAVPWPTIIEGPLIQSLTRFNAGVAAEVLRWLGIPALTLGNIIQVSTGPVGIDDACSGIRSLQASLMIALFLGEFYRLAAPRRVGLCVAGMTLAVTGNLLRTGLLVGIAAKHGIAAIARWHDPAGLIMLFVCLSALALLAGSFRTKPSHTAAHLEDSAYQQCPSPVPSPQGEGFHSALPGFKWILSRLRHIFSQAPNTTDVTFHPARPQSFPLLGERARVRGLPSLLAIFFRRSGPVVPNSEPHCSPPTANTKQRITLAIPLALPLWLIVVESGVELWYRSHERNLPNAVTWRPQLPRENASLQEQPLTAKARQLLRFDEGFNAVWAENSTRWQLIFLSWKPGRTATHLARSHTPDVCLPASGYRLISSSELEPFQAGTLSLPFRGYVAEDDGDRFYVFSCLWEDRGSARQLSGSQLDLSSRWAAVRAGRRNLGQRCLEIVVSGFADTAAAESAVRRQVARLIKS